MKYPAYPKYNDSGVEWLEDVPDGWEVKPLKRVCDVRDGTHDTPEFVPQDENTFPLVTSKDISIGEVLYEEAKHIAKEDYEAIARRSAVSKGDILMPMIGTVGGAVLVQTDTLFAIKNIALFRKSKNFESRWLLYMLNSEQSSIQFDLEKTGGVQRFVGLGTLRNLIFTFPPFDEQTTIANFLDQATGKIDTLVAKKRNLIELLKEKRTALISRTVTRGLPAEVAREFGLEPHTRFKDSGIEWLGEVPEGWKMKRVKHIGQIRYGLGEPPAHDPDGIPFIRATDIKRGKIDLDAVKRVNFDDVPWNRRPKLELEEILVVRSGAYTGDSAIVTNEVAGCLAGYDMVLTVDKSVPSFVAWVMLSKYMIESQIHITRLRAAQPHLNAEELGGFVILVPPCTEQTAIANYLDHETTKLDRLINKVQTAITRLQEYRTALITAAVTGKICVSTENTKGNNE